MAAESCSSETASGGTRESGERQASLKPALSWVSGGDVPPSEAEKFCIFETGIVQFDEYFWHKFRAGNE